MNTAVLASSSELKQRAVREAFAHFELNPTVVAIGVDIAEAVAPQPFGDDGGEIGTRSRISAVKQHEKFQEYFAVRSPRWVVAVENYVRPRSDGDFEDVSLCAIQSPVDSSIVFGRSRSIVVPAKYVEMAKAETPSGYKLLHTGLAVTAGKMIEKHSGIEDIQHDNWMEHIAFGGFSRVAQVKEAVVYALLAEQAMQISDHVRANVAFAPGSVVPVSLAPLFASNTLLRSVVSLLTRTALQRVDYVMGRPGQSMCLAAALACHLNAGLLVTESATASAASTVTNAAAKTDVDGEMWWVRGPLALTLQPSILCVDDCVRSPAEAHALITLAQSLGGAVPLYLSLFEGEQEAGDTIVGMPATRHIVLFRTRH